jgi:hypothetical protein
MKILAILANVMISILLSGPFLVLGVLLIIGSSEPGLLGFAVLLLGVAILVVGLYVSCNAIAPEPPLQETETELTRRHPSMKPAYARMVVSLPFLGCAAYLLESTDMPYIYPFAVFLVGMYLFFQGAIRCIRNLHTTYIVTDRRALKMYKFLWLNTREIPVSRIVSISEVRGLFELLTGRGTVVVASGVGERQIVRMQDITNPAPVADILRRFLC